MRAKKLKKLQFLVHRKESASDESKAKLSRFAPPVINLTYEAISNNELYLLSKEKKFLIMPTGNNDEIKTTLVVNLVASAWNDRRPSSDRIEDLVTNIISTMDAPPSSETR